MFIVIRPFYSCADGEMIEPQQQQQKTIIPLTKEHIEPINKPTDQSTDQCLDDAPISKRFYYLKKERKKNPLWPISMKRKANDRERNENLPDLHPSATSTSKREW